jgi:hypothetical protein
VDLPGKYLANPCAMQPESAVRAASKSAIAGAGGPNQVAPRTSRLSAWEVVDLFPIEDLA